nr:DUF6283 family protein [Nocardia panacis]
MGPPAPRPCASCPYRRDVPSGIWHESEYNKLRSYDLDTAYQPTALFECHQTEPDTPAARMCAGWVGCLALVVNSGVVWSWISAAVSVVTTRFRSRILAPLVHPCPAASGSAVPVARVGSSDE